MEYKDAKQSFPDELLTPEEAAGKLRISPFTLMDWLRRGTIRGVKLGRGPKARWRVRLSEVESVVRPVEDAPRLSLEEMQEVASALNDALLAAGVVQLGHESLALIVQDIETPSELWWQHLAAGIRALQARIPSAETQPQTHGLVRKQAPGRRPARGRSK